MMLEQLELPLELPLDELWESVDEDVLSRAARESWHANGLRIGTISRAHLEQVTELLPDALGVRRQRISSRGEPVPLRSSEPLRESVPVHLGAPLREDEAYQAYRGRLRVLGSVRTMQQGGVWLELFPQHHRRRHVVQPRHPREAELDGRIFEELGVGVALSADDLLVIGLHYPWPDHDDESASEEADEAASEEADEADESENAPREPTFEWRPITPNAEADDEPVLMPSQRRAAWREAHGEPPELPDHFGRALVTRERSHHSVQVLMILAVQPPQTRRAERGAAQ